jgi:uncharacterized protein
MNEESVRRYAPALALPPYSYVPGHDLPHPVTDPRGHLHDSKQQSHEPLFTAGFLEHLPPEPTTRHEALAALLAANPTWLYALDLFNHGFYWESHEAWEAFWHALGRNSPEARFIQGLIHLAAAAVKVREGKPTGVSRHTQRARQLLGDVGVANPGGTLGLAPDSPSAVIAELEKYTPSCWHTSRTPVVRVVAAQLRLAE